MFLAAIYWGALYGGVITSILFAIPGEPWSVALIFDGYPMAKKGNPGLALAAAFFSSFFGMIFAAVLFVLAAMPIALFALKFGPPEMFAIMMLAFSTFVGLGRGSAWKTLLTTAFGLLLTTVGLDLVTGQPRLSFGSIAMLSGFHFVPVTVGLFGLGEILVNAEERIGLKLEKIAAKMGWKDFREALVSLWHRFGITATGTIIGFFIGTLPGTGATPASFVGYGVAKQYSSRPEEFGEGVIEGVIAPQSAAQAAGTAALLPLITLGIPGSPTAAVLMAALFMYGLIPGPRMFMEETVFVWGLIASLFIANFICLIICLGGTPLLAAIMRVPWGILTPIIVVALVVGGYAMRNFMTDVWHVFIFGILGYVMKKLKYPLAPLAVALVLGEMTESNLRRSLIMGDGSFSIFIDHTIALIILIIAVILFVFPFVRAPVLRLFGKKAAPKEVKEEELE
jgi:putative tricarboxylic transport membrane protein